MNNLRTILRPFLATFMLLMTIMSAAAMLDDNTNIVLSNGATGYADGVVQSISITENGDQQNITLVRTAGLPPIWATFTDNNTGSGGGFTTDQNDELNTTGRPDFRSVTTNFLYPDTTYSAYPSLGGALPWERWYFVFAENVYAYDKGLFPKLGSGNDEGIILVSNIVPENGGSLTLGNSTHFWGSLYVNETIYPQDLTSSLGDVSYRFNDVYATGNLSNGTDSIAINDLIAGTTGSGSGSSLWWNDSEVATYNGSVRVRDNLTVQDIELYQNASDAFIKYDVDDDYLHFVVGDRGGAVDFMQIGGTDSNNKLIISPNVTTGIDVAGLLKFEGDYTFSSIGILMGASGTYKGNNFFLFNAYPTLNVTGVSGIFRFNPQYTVDSDHKATLIELVTPTHVIGNNDNFKIIDEDGELSVFAFSDDDTTINYEWFNVGNKVIFGNIPGVKNANVTDIGYAAKGGLDRINIVVPSSAGKLYQIGHSCSGFGDITNPEPDDFVECFHSDGGIFNLTGNSDLYADDYFSGTGNQGITYNVSLSECWMDYEDGLLVATNCTGGS